jgi:hypothetical protein
MTFTKYIIINGGIYYRIYLRILHSNYLCEGFKELEWSDFKGYNFPAKFDKNLQAYLKVISVQIHIKTDGIQEHPLCLLLF